MGKELRDFAELGAKVSTAWDIGAQEAAQMLTEVKAQTQWTIPQLKDFGDKVNFLGDISAAAEKDIGAMFQRAAAGAKASGMAFDDSLVAMTALRSVGMQEETGSRFLGQMTSRLRAASSQTKKAKEGFKELGYTTDQLEKGMQKDAFGTLVEFLDRLSKSKNPIALATAIGGREWADEMMIATQALSEFIRLRNELKSGKAKGSLDNAMKIDLETLDNQLARAKQSVLDFMAAWAAPALPEWARLFKDIANGADRLRETLDPELQGALNKLRGGGAISESERKTIEASPRARTFLNPSGRSSSQFERDVVNRPSGAMGRAPQFTRMDMGAPSLDLSKIENATGSVLHMSDQMKGALGFTASPTVDVGGAYAALMSLVTAANQAKAAIDGAKASAASMPALPNWNGMPAPSSVPRFDKEMRGSYSAAGDPAGK